MLSILVSVCLGFAYALEVWLNSSAFVDYMRLIHLNKLFFIDDYLMIKQSAKDNGWSNDSTYVEFLIEYHDSFFVRLISCPTCLSFWSSLLSTSFTGWYISDYSLILFVFPLAFLILFLYRLLNKLT